MHPLQPAAEAIVKQIEEAAFNDIKSHGRYDLLDALEASGYELTERHDGLLHFVVGGETVLIIRIGPEGALERLN